MTARPFTHLHHATVTPPRYGLHMGAIMAALRRHIRVVRVVVVLAVVVASVWWDPLPVLVFVVLPVVSVAAAVWVHRRLPGVPAWESDEDEVSR